MGFFRDISISNKILIPPIIMTAALGVVLILAINGFNKQNSIFNEVYNIALERTTLVNEFISLSETVQSDLFRIAVLRFMNLPKKEILLVHEHLQQGLSDMSIIYGHILGKWPLDQEEREILEKMKVPLDAFKQQAQQATAVVLENPSFGIIMVRSAAVPFADFRALLTEFLNDQKKKIVHAETIFRRAAETVKITTTAIAIFMALIAILTTVWIGTRLISRPVRSITDVMEQLSAGNLSVEVADLHSKDEVGSMARALEVFRRNAIEKQAAEETLREIQERYRSLAQTAKDAIISLESGGKIVFWNKAAETIFGYSPEEVLDRPLAIIIPEQFREPHQKGLRSVVLGGEPKMTGKTIEVAGLRKDGHEIPLEISLSALHTKEGLFFTGILRDITERKRIEGERQELIDRLQKTLAEVKTLKGIFPICASCKKIRDDRGYWSQVEVYIRDHSEAEFSHSICPECMKKLYPDFADEEK